MNTCMSTLSLIMRGQYIKYFITVTRKITNSNTMFLQVGPSCLAGLLVLGFLLPFNALYLGRKAMKLQVDLKLLLPD